MRYRKKKYYHSVTYSKWGRRIRLHFNDQAEEGCVSRVLKRSKWKISMWG